MSHDYQQVIEQIASKVLKDYRFAGINLEHKDLVQEGWLIFLRDKELYNPSKNTSFISFIYRKINWGLRKYANKLVMQKKQREQYVVSHNNESVTHPKDIEALTKALATFNEEELNLVKLHFTDGLSYKEMSNVIGLSKFTIQKRINRLIKALKLRVKKYDADFVNTGM